jgi:PAS domain S-box-containing protein
MSWKGLRGGKNTRSNVEVNADNGGCSMLSNEQEYKEWLFNLKDTHQTILDNAFDAIISIDMHGVILDWNRRAESIFGWKVEEVCGKLLTETIIPKQFRSAHIQGLNRFLETGKSRVLNQQLELSALHRNGHEFPIEISISPSRLNDQLIFTGIIRDITERKNALKQVRLRAEEYKVLHEVAQALQNSESMEAMLLEAMEAVSQSKELHVENKAGVFLADEEKRVLHLTAKLGKFPGGFLKNQTEIPFYNIPYGRCFTSGEMVINDWCMFHPQQAGPFGDETQYGSYIVPLKSRNDTVGVLFLYTPETPPCYEGSKEILLSIAALIGNAIKHRQFERKIHQQNKKLKAYNILKNKFLGIASHDLRNPVYLILSYSNILTDGSIGGLNERQRKILDKITHSCEFMRGLLNNLLDISKIESGQIALEKIPQNINSLVQNQVEMNQLLANKKNIQLDFQKMDLPQLTVDKCAMIQVIDNLIGNAIKFSPKNSRVLIKTENSHNHFRFSIKDEGPGISEQDRKLAFGEFQTLGNRPTGGEKSTGLGLAISKKIVRLHGGKVGLDSELGKGSTFYFELPLQ